MKLDTEINRLVSTLHNRINTIRQIKKYTDFQTRLKFLNANVLPKLDYMLPFYSSLNDELVHKLHKVLMTSARMAIGNYCFKTQCTKILAKCNWLPIRYMINNAQCNYIHKILTYKSPKKLFDFFIVRNRQVKDLRLNYHLLYNGLNFYNRLPSNIK